MQSLLDDVTARQLLTHVAGRQRRHRLPSIVAAVTDRGHTLWVGTRGYVATGPGGGSPDGGAPPSSATQYRIGSITKTFTAVLVLQLRDEGRLRLSDTVGAHLPDVGPAVGDRRIDELLSHTGGLRAEPSPPWWERAEGRTWEELSGDLGADGERSAVRGRFHYSNVGFAVLGRLVSRLRDAPYATVLADRLLRPLELGRTSPDPHPPATQGLAVHPWRDAVLAEPSTDTAAMAPAGQLWSSATDLSRWARFLLGDTADVIADDTLEEMAVPRSVVDLAGGAGYGLGLDIVHHHGRTLVGHRGSMPGFVAEVFVDRRAGTGGTILTNSTAGPGTDLVAELLGTLAGRRPDPGTTWHPSVTDAAPHPVGRDDAAGPGGDRAGLLGTWCWGPRPYTLSAHRDGSLDLTPQDADGRATRLVPDGPDSWTARGGYFEGEPAHVVRGPDGTPRHLEVASFVFTREPYAPADVVPGGVAGPGDGWMPAR